MRINTCYITPVTKGSNKVNENSIKSNVYLVFTVTIICFWLVCNTWLHTNLGLTGTKWYVYEINIGCGFKISAKFSMYCKSKISLRFRKQSSLKLRLFNEYWKLKRFWQLLYSNVLTIKYLNLSLFFQISTICT